MKKLAALTALSLSALLIVLPDVCSVNYSASNSLIARARHYLGQRLPACTAIVF
jgi:hypothetical protein